MAPIPESKLEYLFETKSLIFATGGAGKSWEVTSNSWEYTGDGYGMAYEAGAELIDMEFNCQIFGKKLLGIIRS